MSTDKVADAAQVYTGHIAEYDVRIRRTRNGYVLSGQSYSRGEMGVEWVFITSADLAAFVRDWDAERGELEAKVRK